MRVGEWGNQVNKRKRGCEKTQPIKKKDQEFIMNPMSSFCVKINLQ